MSRDGMARPVLTWRLLFLSTGEISLADKIAEARRGARVMAVQEVRVLDLPADTGAGHGVFDALHGFATGQALADHLKESVRLNYGHPLRAFLRRLVEEPWESGARASIKRFVSEVVPAGADGQVRRAARRFAVIAAAGELAARWEIVPWPEGEATEAASRLFREWLAARGGHEPAEIAAGIAAVRGFLEEHASTRFVPWDDPARPVAHRAGFVRPGPDGPTYYVLPEGWREILAGHDARMIAKELVRRGMLKSTPDGKPQTKQRPPGGKASKFYVVLPSFWTEHRG